MLIVSIYENINKKAGQEPAVKVLKTPENNFLFIRNSEVNRLVNVIQLSV